MKAAMMAHPAPSLNLYAVDGRREYLNAAERALPGRDRHGLAEARTFCLALAYLGSRISEALALTAGDVQLAAGIVSIRTLKTARPARCARGAGGTGPHQGSAGRPRPRPAGGLALAVGFRTTAWAAVKLVMDLAEVRGLPASPKGLRHAFGVHAVMSGVPLNLIQKWLGHANIATTAIYTNVLGPENARSPDACGAD